MMGAVWLRPLAAALLGALAGYAYFKLVGCRTGTCSLTATPLRSMTYFAGLGALLGWPR